MFNMEVIMGKLKTQEQFALEMESKNPNIIVIGKYISAKTKIDIKCKICGNVWMATPNHLLEGHGCRNCMRTNLSNRKKSNQEFISDLKKVNPNIITQEKYIDSKTQIKVECSVCGYTWQANPNNLLRGRSCPKCSGKYRRTHKDFIEEMKSINPNIRIITDYKGVHSKVKCRCNIDGCIWLATPHNLLHGTGCPICNASKGENRINSYLTNHNINFISQMSFDGLIGIRGGRLSYDFYLPEDNLLIEYQGEFHDGNIISGFQTKESSYSQKEHDKRKKQYAKSNNINLLEIWYYDFDNIDSILRNILRKER